MGMVQHKSSIFDPLTEEQLAELAALESRPIDFSDIPPSTPEELAELRQHMKEMRKKVMFSIRLQKSTILWWKRHFGAGYTSLISRLIDEAPNNTHWIKECMQPTPGEVFANQRKEREKLALKK